MFSCVSGSSVSRGDWQSVLHTLVQEEGANTNESSVFGAAVQNFLGHSFPQSHSWSEGHEGRVGHGSSDFFRFLIPGLPNQPYKSGFPSTFLLLPLHHPPHPPTHATSQPPLADERGERRSGEVSKARSRGGGVEGGQEV